MSDTVHLGMHRDVGSAPPQTLAASHAAPLPSAASVHTPVGKQVLTVQADLPVAHAASGLFTQSPESPQDA